VNAISTPGGYVFVTKGALLACKDDNQLAAIIAHEIAHVTRRHALKLIARNEGLKGMTELASIAGGSNVGAFDDLIGKTLKTILEKGFDPETECDADRHGTLLLYDAGFTPTLLRDFLAELAKQSDGKNFSTHPATSERVEKLDEYIKTL
jgi:predicted Zn-dependent protease